MRVIPYSFLLLNILRNFTVFYTNISVTLQFPDLMGVETLVGIGWLQFPFQNLFQTVDHHSV